MNPSSDTMLALESLKVLVGLFIVFPKLPDDILTNITVILLDLARNLEVVFRRNSRHFPPLPHQVEHKLRNITSSDRDMLDRTSDDIAFSAGNDVRHTVA